MKNTKTKGANARQKYLIGFVLSLLLTLASYFLVKHHVNSGHVSPSDNVSVLFLMVFALSQLLVQLVFFLHVGQGEAPRWKLVMTLFAAMVVFILVAGSLWIMWNLNYHMAPPQNDQQIIHDEGVHL
jgi:cytochrome o ubiquinol oxidase operon protein cyoD